MYELSSAEIAGRAYSVCWHPHGVLSLVDCTLLLVGLVGVAVPQTPSCESLLPGWWSPVRCKLGHSVIGWMRAVGAQAVHSVCRWEGDQSLLGRQ
jgi:hypothetical protein